MYYWDDRERWPGYFNAVPIKCPRARVFCYAHLSSMDRTFRTKSATLTKLGVEAFVVPPYPFLLSYVAKYNRSFTFKGIGLVMFADAHF